MSRVFVSSPVFDLIDVRAEVERLLSEMRLIPVVSGIVTSGFQPLPDQNSIETCLANLRQCDCIIVILSQRYGPSLKPAGFPDVSATHLEYSEAKKLNKPIRMYVRDRLEADYRIHRKNKGTGVKLLWVPKDEDRRLFELMDEHMKLVTDTPGSNWYDTFRDSIELKAIIKRDFGPVALRSDLEGLITNNRVPIIAVDVNVAPPKNPSSYEMVIDLRLRNVGTVPAYRVSWSLEGRTNGGQEMPVLAPEQETHQGIVYGYDGHPWNIAMKMTYYMAQGHYVNDEYRIGVWPMGATAIASGATCHAKTYHVASGDVKPFVVADSLNP
jgi:hypothetical protein